MKDGDNKSQTDVFLTPPLALHQTQQCVLCASLREILCVSPKKPTLNKSFALQVQSGAEPVK